MTLIAAIPSAPMQRCLRHEEHLTCLATHAEIYYFMVIQHDGVIVSIHVSSSFVALSHGS